MTNTDTRAALDAAILKYGGDAATSYEFHARPPDDRDLNAAITAHVEAEVTRRLAAAPSVEEAIRTFGLGAYSPGEPSAPDSLAAAQIWIEIEAYGHAAPLRAAIAADRERAVEAGSLTALDEFRKLLPKYEPPRITASTGIVPVVADAEGRMLGGRREGRDTIYDQIKVPVAMARPTPDEARRLVEEYGNAVVACIPAIEAGAHGDCDAVNAMADVIDRGNKTLAALLRALGVEA